MADPKKNPLIGAFRAPVPGAPPDTPAPPEERTGGPQGPCGHYSQAR